MGMAWATYGAPMGTAVRRRDRTARQRRARPPAQRPAPRPERRAPPRWRRPIVRPPLLALLIALFFAFLDFVALYLVISAYIEYPDRIYREIYWDPADAGAGDSGTGRRRAVIRSPSLESRPVPCGSRAELGDLRVSPTGRRTPARPRETLDRT